MANNALPILLAAGAAFLLFRGKEQGEGEKEPANGTPSNLKMFSTADEYEEFLKLSSGPEEVPYVGSITVVTPTPDDEWIRGEVAAAAKQVPDIVFLMPVGDLALQGWENGKAKGEITDEHVAAVALMSPKHATRSVALKTKEDIPKAVIAAIQTIKS